MEDEQSAGAEAKVEVLREAMTMSLYLSIVLLATFVALPAGSEEAHGDTAGIHGARLIGLIWGTAIGLALAHWFAFRVTAFAFGKGSISEKDVKIGFAQLAAAAAVAALCSIPVLMADHDSDVDAATYIPALILGFAGYVVARQAERSRARAVALGAVVLMLGLAVASVKNFLLGH